MMSSAWKPYFVLHYIILLLGLLAVCGKLPVTATFVNGKSCRLNLPFDKITTASCRLPLSEVDYKMAKTSPSWGISGQNKASRPIKGPFQANLLINLPFTANLPLAEKVNGKRTVCRFAKKMRQAALGILIPVFLMTFLDQLIRRWDFDCRWFHCNPSPAVREHVHFDETNFFLYGKVLYGTSPFVSDHQNPGVLGFFFGAAQKGGEIFTLPKEGGRADWFPPPKTGIARYCYFLVPKNQIRPHTQKLPYRKIGCFVKMNIHVRIAVKPTIEIPSPNWSKNVT